ncbi:MAG: VWA domain-containing protein [Lachnospiraceae bacterium]|jgi:Ca-activated chloride channel family protein|nr:VWA domain-containing protein [Lachnospiraceae bacterium]
MKKKGLAVFMAMVLSGISLCGCGGDGGNAASNINVGGSDNGMAGGQMEGMTSETFNGDGGLSYDVSGDMDLFGEIPAEAPGVEWNTEEYNSIREMGFRSVANAPLSTFSADVDTASYSNLRRMIEQGCSMEQIPAGAVRIEELLNYFSYDYNLPKGKEPFGVTAVMGDCPWNSDARLLQIGLKTEEIDFGEAPDSNLVFLLDVSGSMYSQEKLPLLQRSFGLLAEELTEKDKVSIITYAGSDTIVLEGVSGDEKEKIREALDSLEASGSTNGAGAIESAYRLAEQYFIEGGNNRIILATDGDLNVGASSESELEKLVTQKRKSGVYLSVLGFGMGNIKDNKMETLADKGNGNYAYIDSLKEAKKVLVEQMGATLVTVAKDVKLQVEFNPAYVKGYRLLGYENRMLAAEDFDDDTKDAGEIGAGHMVTALYEIIPVDSAQEIPETDLKYQEKQSAGVENGEWLNLKVRYKDPDSDSSELCTYAVTEEAYSEQPSEDFYFAAAVAEFGLLVRDSEYKKDASFENIRNLLKKVDTGADEYRDEFEYLVRQLERNS